MSPDFAPKARSVPLSLRNPLSRVLLWASKTDCRLLSVCSRWAGYHPNRLWCFRVFHRGARSRGCLLHTLYPERARAVCSLACARLGSVYLFLDREIVGSLDKTSAIVRPFLALFIGMLVAIPIELWVFQGRVDQELQRQYRQDNSQQLDELRAGQAKLDQRREEIQATLVELRKQHAEWGRVMDQELAGRSVPGRTGLAGPGSVFKNAQTQQELVHQRMQEARQDLGRLDREMPEENRRTEERFKREEVGRVTDFVTRYEAMVKVIHSSDALYRLSWLITLALILVEMTPALLKILTPHVDYHHLVQAEIRENVARIDEISERNYRLAMENPEAPVLSVAEKFTRVRYAPIDNVSSFGRRYGAQA